jgi:hypothetical protein
MSLQPAAAQQRQGEESGPNAFGEPCSYEIQGGSDTTKSCLLLSVDGSGSQQVDMAVTRQQRDQGEEQGGKNRDPALNPGCAG